MAGDGKISRKIAEMFIFFEKRGKTSSSPSSPGTARPNSSIGDDGDGDGHRDDDAVPPDWGG